MSFYGGYHTQSRRGKVGARNLKAKREAILRVWARVRYASTQRTGTVKSFDGYTVEVEWDAPGLVPKVPFSNLESAESEGKA